MKRLLPFLLSVPLLARFVTWWIMFAHLMGKLSHGEFHIERCETKGPIIFGVHIGVIFLRRYCYTCGYLKDLL
jgi:hypothetical protein